MICRKSLVIEIDKSEERVEQIRNLFRLYNCDNNVIGNEIVQNIRNANQNSFNIYRANRHMHKIDFIRTDSIKFHCKLIVFIITETYLQSELFKKNLIEAIKLNKKIVFFTQDTIDMKDPEFEKFEIIRVNKDILQNPFDDQKQKLNDCENLFEFYLDLTKWLFPVNRVS